MITENIDESSKSVNLYIEKYKELEKVVRRIYKLNRSDSVAHFLENNIFVSQREEIRYCTEVRNFIQHTEKIEQNSFAIQPTEEMMKFIELLINKIEHREKCKDAAVPFRKIMFAKYNDSVKKYMSAMHKNLFTHIPIINDSNCVIGVFDENSIFNFLSNETIIEIDEKILFSDIKEYLSLDDRDMETFIFFKNGAYVDDLLQDFNEKFKNRSRLEAVFLTSTGRKNEPLLGMITAWDLLGRYNN